MTDRLTDAELAAIAARADATLPGPWKAFVEGRDHFGGDDFIRTGGTDSASPDMYVSLSHWSYETDRTAPVNVLDFIASAREDIPRLVAEIRRLRLKDGSGH